MVKPRLFPTFMHVPRPVGVSSQSGQIGVIILLIMAVLLTAGLSLAVRTTQELFLSQQSAESTRVFNAAEAGIEEALSNDLTFEGDSSEGTITNIENTSVDYTINKVRNLETKLFEGVTVMVDVTGTTTGSSLTIDWSRSDTCPGIAALLVDIYSQSGSYTVVRHETLAGCDVGDGFTLGASGNNGGYRRRSTVALQTGDLFVRIKPLYADTDIRVAGNSFGGWVMPVQYYNIRSQARNERGDETRIVEVNRTLPTAPSVMDYVLYSGTTINK
jgi:hypothetical protein